MGVKEVAAGAAWLDEVSPGWEREIDLGTLKMQDCYNCILGQGVRVAALKAIGLSVQEGKTAYSVLYDEYGVDWVTNHAFSSEFNEPLWVELIKERFSTGNLSDNHVE